uniref:Uncharacterized protein n=1 Tax=Trichobilharzia regenti TaxID=157069 RepID=A0AA85IYW4_TRIRE|nr:unnamed protein product [Trichobilharzia regenti]
MFLKGDASALWNSLKERVESGEFFFDLYLLIYNFFRYCFLDFDNLREAFFPSRFYDKSPVSFEEILKAFAG